MAKLIEIKANVGIIFVPLYCKTTTKLIQDFQIQPVHESVFVDTDCLDEIIINEIQEEITVFNSGHEVVAEKGSGYLYLNFTPSPFADQSGTYLFPMSKAMSEFQKVDEELKAQLNSAIIRSKWEEVTVFRRIK